MISQAEEEVDEEGLSLVSTEADSLTESIDKLDLTSQSSAMSSVFGTRSADTDTGSSKRSSSHSPSHTRHGSDITPARTASPSGFHLPSFRHHRRTMSQRSSAEEKETRKHDDHLARWLTSGNVIYKSVGLGLMDLVVGLEVIKLANARGVGTHVENFSP